ncbi:MAG: electron transfer flavoprotein subunit alpha, partial [Candidatus Microthrix sp.]|nr:electron transfer flavoprotein subunit alpha [Candidatus Microthrix sp.]
MRAVTDEAVELAMSRIFKAPEATGPGPVPSAQGATPGRVGGARPVLFGGRPVGRLAHMNVVVCVKQIPDPAEPGDLDPETKTLKREGKLILDESDSYGVEMALQLVDNAGEGEVTLISMAPNEEVSGLRTALAMGAAKAILISDPALAGSDALTTAKVLAAA